MLCHRKDALITVIIAVIFIFTGCNASETFNNNTGPFMPEDVTPEWVNLYTYDFCIDGDFLYVSTYWDGLHIFDVSDYPTIKITAHLPEIKYKGKIEIDEGLAVINCYGELNLVDISNPTAPKILNKVRIDEPIYDFDVYENRVFIASWFNGLVILDATNPLDVKTAAKVKTDGSAVAVEFHDGRAYVGESPYGVEVFDCADPGNPAFVARFSTSNRVVDIEVDGDYFYTIDWVGKFTVFSLGQSGYIASETVDYGEPRNLTVSGGHAYISGEIIDLYPHYLDSRAYGFIQTVDISNPLNPYKVEYMPLIKPVPSLDSLGEVLFAAFDKGGVYTFRTAVNGDLAHELTIGSQFEAYCIKTIGDLVYASDRQQGIRLIDALPPEDFHHIGIIQTGSPPGDFDIDSGVIVASTLDNEIQILNMDLSSTDPVLKVIELDNYAVAIVAIVASGGYAFAGIYREGLAVVDIFPAESARIVAQIPEENYIQDIETSGNLLIYATYYGVNFVDISDPEKPLLIKTIETEHGSCGIDIANGRAYVTTQWKGLLVIDIDPVAEAHVLKEIEIYPYDLDKNTSGSDSSETKYAGNMPPMPYPVDVKVSGKYAYIAISHLGLVVVDIDPIENSHIVSFNENYFTIYDIDVVDSYALLATYGGVRIIKLW